MTGSSASARILLKARPTPEQLADRLRAPLPEGLELYLDVADIAGDGWLELLETRIGAHAVPEEFVWIVEGPLRSLDGGFFDLARDAEADYEVMVRLAECAKRIGAPGVVIHCIALVQSTDELTSRNRERALARAEAMLARYTRLCLQHDVVPTIENVPPVARMREARFAHSLIGMSPDDLVYFADHLPGLRVTCDTSHAQLYLNALARDPSGLPPELAAAARYVAESSSARTLVDYVELLGPRIYEAHISNAAGLLDEGLPYGEGEVDLDEVVGRLLKWARFLVTEPIELNPDRGERMSEVARRICAVRRRATAGGASRVTNEPRQTDPTLQALSSGDIDLHRLLERPPLPIDEASIRARVAGRRVLVTGAGGSIGTRLAVRLCDWGAGELVLVDSHENSLYELQNHLGSGRQMVFRLADVRDPPRLSRLFARHRPDLLFHLAAYKHVPLGEENADQVFAANVLGTRNVLEAAAEAGVDVLVYPSTDKAVYPPSIYGATKRMVELMLRAFAAESGAPRCAVVRLVNAVGAQGGVIRVFTRQILEGRPLTLTHEGMTRYWMSIDEAALVVAQTGCADARATLLVPDVGPAVRMTAVAHRLQAMLRPGSEAVIRITGMRPGERLAEILTRDDESLEPGPFPGLLTVCDRGPARPSLADMYSAIVGLERLLSEGDDEGLRRQLFALGRG